MRATLDICGFRRRLTTCQKMQRRGQLASTAFQDGRLMVERMAPLVAANVSDFLAGECSSRGEGDGSTEWPIGRNSSCNTKWVQSPANWLDHYRQHRFNIFLPLVAHVLARH